MRKRGNGEGTISKRADGRYTAALYVSRPDGTRGRKWIYGSTRAEVARELARLAQRVESGAVIPTRSPTLSDYLTTWLNGVVAPGLRPTTLAKYRTAVELYLRPGLGQHRLDKLTVAIVQGYLNARHARGDSVAKLEMMRTALSSALGRAVREELLPRNVAQLTTLPTVHQARRTAWTAAQARAFLRAAADDTAYPVFVLALVYGLRRGEIAGLMWEDVDFANGRIHIRSTLVRVDGRLVRGPAKTAAGSASCRSCRSPAPRCPPSATGRPINASMSRATGMTPATCSPPAPAARSNPATCRVPSTGSSPAGLPGIVFHDLRRTTATLLKSLGVPARDAQTILGHANITVTFGIYSEVFDPEIATALGRVNDALDEPASPGS